MIHKNNREIEAISFTLTFDRPVGDNDYISPGGYHGITKDGKEFGFDFYRSGWSRRGNKVDYEASELDTETFPESVALQPEDIASFTDFYVYLDENSDIELIEVSELTFEMSNGDMVKIAAPERDSYVFG